MLQSLLLEPRVLFLILNIVAMVVLLVLRAVLQVKFGVGACDVAAKGVWGVSRLLLEGSRLSF